MKCGIQKKKSVKRRIIFEVKKCDSKIAQNKEI